MARPRVYLTGCKESFTRRGSGRVKNNIRSLREALGMTQEDVAKQVGVTRQTIIAIENDKYNPTLNLAFKLARLFGRPIEEIFQDQ
ncbi:MAG: Transcriptional regulator, family [Symbiobacteriaceae bacterium]|nr:Transcriptional regulator, family [Symbiobacteriaceae bacterium]